MSAAEQFDLLADLLRADPDLDVDRRDSSLVVGERAFAHLDGTALVVLLPESRAVDLIDRDIAKPAAGDAPDGAHWVSIDDTSDWNELANEAHTFARGRLPGRES
ncbi:hypothetical protein [Agromyces seonyuensis]|nr:hypothetical protein [Agromyces seonyuensis]